MTAVASPLEACAAEIQAMKASYLKHVQAAQQVMNSSSYLTGKHFEKTGKDAGMEVVKLRIALRSHTDVHEAEKLLTGIIAESRSEALHAVTKDSVMRQKLDDLAFGTKALAQNAR